MQNTNVEFREQMYVYSAQYVSPYNTVYQLKVNVPEAFIDISTSEAQSRKTSNGSNNIFINNYQPAISGTIHTNNFITLPCSQGQSDVQIGTRFLAMFVGGNPKNGIILARC